MAGVLELYTPLVFGNCRRAGLPEADAADVAQEVMVAVARAIRTFEYDRARGSFRSWLLSVTRSKLCRFVSRRDRQPRALTDTAGLDALEAPASGDEQAAWEREYQQLVFERAAARVRGEVKNVTWQAFWKTGIENRPGQEVAHELGLKLGWVYVAKKRVLERLQAVVAELADDETLAGGADP